MSTEDYNIVLSRKAKLRAEVTYLMIKGAGYAALLVIGIWLSVEVMAGIGRLLPDESRETPDPTPLSQIMLPDDMVFEVV